MPDYSSIIGGFLNFLLGMFTNSFNAQNIAETNASNERSVRETNQTNLQISRETNDANAAQAHAAYLQSLPETQVRDMISAGISKGAALQKVAGGGTYTAPVMQPATMQASQKQAFQADTGAIQAAIDRWSSIPSNVIQRKLQQQEMDKIRMEMFHAEQEEKRKQELHDYEVWQRQYGKDIATITDAFNSKIMAKVAEGSINLDNISSKHQFINAFGLANDKDWIKLPKIVQDKFFNDTLLQAKELRDIQSSDDSHQSAIDAHKAAEQNIKQLKAHYEQWKKEQNARDKELKNRELEADIRSIMLDMQYHDEDLKRDFKFERGKDGHIRMTPHAGISAVANEFWKTLGSIIGLDYVGDILGRMFVGLVK